MNAKELRDEIATKPGAYVVSHPEHQSTILRALDLLAATEGSEDAIVRELRGQHCRDFGSDPQCDADGLCICAMHERAAAALVAERAAKEKAEAERDRLKARWFADDDPKETEYAAEFDAYRREFQKEEA